MTAKLLVTAKEAAELLSIGVSEVYLLAADGSLDKAYIGRGKRQFRIPVASLERYVNTLPREPTPP